MVDFVFLKDLFGDMFMLRKISLSYSLSLIAALLSAALSTIALANTVIPIPTQPQPIITPGTPNLDAKSYLLMDANSGKILAEKNSDTRMAPASLTKLMS